MHRLAIEKVPFAVGNSQAEDAVVEVPVLLESQLLTVLESAACAHGISPGTLVRRLIRDFLYCSDVDLPAPGVATNAPEQESATA